MSSFKGERKDKGKVRQKKITAKVLPLLEDALRRFDQFAVSRDGLAWTLPNLQKAWTGMGFVSEYQPAVAAGMMKQATAAQPRCMAWWVLTEEGARVVLAMHEDRLRQMELPLE